MMGFISGAVSAIKSTVSKAVSTVASVVKNPAPAVIKAPATVSKAVTTTNTAIVKATPTIAAAGATLISPSSVMKAIVGTAKVAAKNPVATGAAVIVVPTVLKSSTAKETLIQGGLNLPTSINNYTTNLAKTIDNPTKENFLETGRENPFLLGGTALLGGAVLGKSVLTLTNFVSNYSNTAAIKENTDVMKETLKNAPEVILKTDDKPAKTTDLPKPINTTPAVLPTTSTNTSPVPITPETQVLGKPAGSSSIKRYARARTIQKPNIQSVRVNIFNQTKSLYTHTHRRR